LFFLRANRSVFGFALLSLMVGIGSFPRAEELTIEIDGGSVEALPIAIVPFQFPTEFLGDPAEIIRSDLTITGKFVTLAKENMISKPTVFSEINFKDWRLLGVENLLIGSIARAADGLALSFSLIDVFRESELLKRRIPISEVNFRIASHHISDLIYLELLGKKGDFSTKIAYVVFEALAGEYQLVVADSDGYNPRPVFRSSEPILSPAWSPDGGSLAYVSFEDGRSAVFVQDLETGSRRKIRLGSGITGSPAFSPNGNRLVLTSSRDGNPNLYIYNLLDGSSKQITSHRAIDTEGSWSPDGRGLVFTSDRGGGAQIYYIDLITSKAKRLTFDMGSYNANAEYSHDGKSIVLISRGGRGHRVSVLDLSKQKWRFLSDSILDESPSFSPNGDMVIYSSRVGKFSKLIALSTDGSMASRKFTLGQGEIREPAWGPRTD